MGSTEADEPALESLTELPDSAFVSITEQFLLHIDNLYFKEILRAPQAAHIRSVLIDRLIESDNWEHRPDEWMSIGVNFGRLVARMFMHDGWAEPPRCGLIDTIRDHRPSVLSRDEVLRYNESMVFSSV